MTPDSAKTLRWRAKNRERQAEYQRQWRLRNLDKIRLSKQSWMRQPINRVKHTLAQAKRRAQTEQRLFTITIEDLLPLPERCPVLGLLLNYQGNKHGFVDNSPSIDRINTANGYVPGNVRIICWRANRIKSDATTEELEAVLLYMKGRARCLQ